MKNTLINRILTVALLVFGSALASAAQENTKQTKPVVMILGSYHMGNPGRDLNNVKADDVRAAKRQKEIAEFVQILKKFKPTRIAVEQPIENAKLNERYQSYLNGKSELSANEVEQIGFRLAKEMNLKSVTTIDWQGNFDFDKVLESAKTNNQTADTDYFMNGGKTEVGKQSEMMKTADITEIYKYLNDANRVNQWHSYYLKLVRVGKDADYAGTDLVRDWYERNLKIYANITRLTTSPNDRILVIYGAGHLKLLQEFVEQSGEYDLERLSKYL